MPEMCGLSNHPRKGTVEGSDLLLFMEVKYHLTSDQHSIGEQRCKEGCLMPKWLLLGKGRIK